MNNLATLAEVISAQLEEGSSVWFLLFGILFVVSITYLFRGIYLHYRRSVESFYYVIFCIPVIAWSFLFLAESLGLFANGEGTWAYVGISAARLLIPTLLMLHIWSQVSYHPITAAVLFLWLGVPGILIILDVLKMIDPSRVFDSVMIGPMPVDIFVQIIYTIVVFVKSYLLCFNVFYQMPKHMRRSTYQMLGVISVMVVGFAVSSYFSVSENINNVIFCFVCIVIICVLYSVFFIANSSNVIVTSREFVFSSLSTIVITISLKGNILDWNKKSPESCAPLPDPKYKEPYAHYRKRIITTCNGTISPHDENIMNIKGEDGENNFLFTWHEISHHRRKFGYLVEISEITKSYSKLRYFEEIAYFDTLTQLHNRNAYIEQVRRVSAAEYMPLLIIVGDVNNLKKINDTYGHLRGDELLLIIAKTVKANLPEDAFAARIGGDELVALMPNASEQNAVSFIMAVTEALNHMSLPEIGTPSISWGYAVMRDSTENYNEVFCAADVIMYEAKRRSREISRSGIVPSQAFPPNPTPPEAT